MAIIDEGWQPIGKRVAYLRMLSGKTQAQLAAECDVDQSYISHIENGRKSVEKRSLLHKLAAALDVAVTDLTGQPVSARSVDDLATYAGAESIRQVLFLPEPPVELRPLSVLADLSDAAMRARMHADYHGIGQYLPDLLAAATAYADQGNSDALALIVQACVTGSLAFKPVGFVDLAIMLAQRAQQAANMLGEPVHIAAAQFAVAQCALAAGNRERSLTIAANAADEIETVASSRRVRLSDALTWATMLRLHAALSAASLHNASDADEHIRYAQAAASRVEGNPWRMEASPANVDTWRVGIALENGIPDQAPMIARQVDVSRLISPQRKARLEIDRGRALYHIGDYEGATYAFLEADEIAPAELRPRVQVREMTLHMAEQARRGNAALLDLARRVGVTAELGLAAA